SNDFPNNTIAAKSVSTSINAQVSTPVTGKKDVGDKAKGSVTIYNTSNSTASLSNGTQLTASNGQVFLLDSDVKVASSSGDIFSGTKPGTTDANITAKDLGTDGNEPAGTKFAISGSSSIAAKNDNAFSGGTKKTVTVVSNEDLATLRTNIVKNVQGDAQKKLTSQASGDEAVLPIVSDPSLQAQHFDKSVNDEAKQVSLNANVVFSGIAYTKSDLNEYAKTILKDKASQGGNVADKTLNATVGSATLKTKSMATATVLLEAGILPNMDQQDIINNIKDKSLGDAKNTLSSLSQVQEADITFSPPIPLLPSLFPRLPHQISVEIKSQ
ncbi:MAG: baseplate J/gp47 family protein, partial [Candidatus Levyibacteriota bacterium]